MKRKILPLFILIIFTFSLVVPLKQIQGLSSNSSISEADSDIDFESFLSDEPFGQTSEVPLRKISSKTELEIKELNDYGRIKADVTYDSVDYYRLNFTYQNVYAINAHQNDTEGRLQFNLNETVSITAYANLPVVLAVYKNDTLQTDQYTQVITQAIVDENFKAKIGLNVDFLLEYYFFIDVPFARDIYVGPDSQIFPVYNEEWEFNTPMDGEAILNKIMFPVFPFGLVTAGISIAPEVDTDFSAKIQTNSPDIELSQSELKWDTNGSIQTFNYFVPEFFSEDKVNIDFFDFYMDLIISLVFYLSIDIDLLLFNKTFDFKIFSYPIAEAQLSCENLDALSLETDVIPSDNLPFVYSSGYWVYEWTNADHDGLIEPGEEISFDTYIVNIGNGSALSVNSTISCSEFQLNGSWTSPILHKNMENEDFIYWEFYIPANFTGDYFILTVDFEYFAVNGTKLDNYFAVYVPCVQIGNLYLEITEIIFDYEGINNWWSSGEEISISFNVTNRGAYALDNVNISLAAGYDTDSLYTVTLTSSTITNSTSLAVGESAILGTFTIDSPDLHDTGLIFMFLDVIYENATYYVIDYPKLIIPIYMPVPDIDLDHAWVHEYGDGDGIWEAGETVELDYEITNNGDGDAYDITGYLTSANPDINYLVPDVSFPDLTSSASGTSTRAVRYISLNAKNQTAYYFLNLKVTDIRGNEYYFTFNISTEIVEAPSPEITVPFYDYIDLGDGDDVIEPGEYFLLYLDVHITNVAIGVSGEAFTYSGLEFYNASCYYGYMEDEDSWGSGFIVYVPLDYSGDPAYIYFDILAESLCGRKVTYLGYLIISPIPKGDLTPPDITLLGSIPVSLALGDYISFSVEVNEPTPVDEIESGLYGVYLLWSFEVGDTIVTEIFELGGVYYIDLLTGGVGTVYVAVAAMDWAGNIYILDDSGSPFTVEVVPVVSEYPLALLFSSLSLLALLVINYKKFRKT